MNFKFKINKWANFYYFLHNLSECEWPWPYRKKNITLWRKELNNFSKKEKEALNNFKRIYKKYFLKKYLGEYFFTSNNPWSALKKDLPGKDFLMLKEVFKVWNSNFNKIYKKDLDNLKKWKKKLEKEMAKQKRNGKTVLILKKLNILYKTSKKNKEIKVQLLLSSNPTDNYFSGASGERGRGLEGKNIILIELSRCPLERINYVIGIIWHEFIHNSFSNKKLLPLIKKITKSEKEAHRLEEIINRSLFPIGIMSIKILDTPLPLTLSRGYISDINSKQTIKIFNLSNKYLKEKKQFDSNYIKKLKKIIKEK
jgi:hypothetical protein